MSRVRFCLVAFLAVLVLLRGNAYAQQRANEPVLHRTVSEMAQRPGSSVERTTDPNWMGADKFPQLLSVPAPVYKTVGRDFYLVFLSAVGNDGTDTSFRKIFISSRAVTPVTISLMGSIWSTTVYTDPNKLTEISVPNFAILKGNEYDVAYNLVIRVQSEDLVAVYAMSHNWLSSDGYLALPVESLGQKYIVASLRNALNYYGGYSPADVTPRSEFAIAATADNTNVSFTLTADSYGGRYKRGIPYQVTLNRGQVLPILAKDEGILGRMKSLQTDIYYDSLGKPYTQLDTFLIQAYTGATIGNDCDLSGSIISSDQPIAVFSGHERASTPDSLEFDPTRFLRLGISRDHLCEELPPMELWGKKFAVVSSSQDHAHLRPLGGDMIRVFAGADSTVVKLNGVVTTRLQAGTWYQFMAGKMTVVETSKPAMVVKYEQTAGNDVNLPGDPDMTVVQPMENMSTFYTIPTILDPAAFQEHHLTLVVDTSVITQTSLNGKLLPKNIPLSFIPGTPYAYSIFDVGTGQQHVESPKPCYAETFGFGTFDSYTFAGGGDFKYTDSLFAVDLDFDTILDGTVKDSLTGVFSTYAMNDLTDTITIYRYSWERWDSTSFDILDNNFAPIDLAPGASLPVHFRYHPTQAGPDSALVRVWSSARKNVFIKLRGLSTDPDDLVSPKLIDFGRVRVGNSRQDSFKVLSIGTATVEIYPQTYRDAPAGLTVQPILDVLLPGSGSIEVGVGFSPVGVGYIRYLAKVKSNASGPYLADALQSVVIKGRGVLPSLKQTNHDFGKVRLLRPSPVATIAVPNIGDDTTNVGKIFISAGNGLAFKIAEVIPSGRPVFLDTAGVAGSLWNYHATFTPTKLGPDTAIVEIVGTIQNIFDTLYGVGVEPYVIATPPLIDFGTIVLPRLPATLTDADTIRTNAITNTGSMQALIDSLTLTDTTDFHFAFTIKNDPNRSFIHKDTLPEVANANTLNGKVTFSVTRIGDFYDTVSVVNDSRNKPFEFVQGKVRAGHADFGPRSFDLGTIVGCDSLTRSITIRNPFGLSITFDSIALSGNTGGFDLEKFIFPIRIASRDSFHVNVSYQLPIDSLNGDQSMTLKIYGKTGGDDPDLVDSFTFHLIRKIEILNTFAIRPSFTPSAGDAAPFRLPIYLSGDWLKRPELDSFTIFVQLPNDVFEPIGIDRTNSVTQRIATEADNSTVFWDPVQRLYTISLVGQHLSTLKDNSNSLLLTVLMHAFVTPDTVSIAKIWIETVMKPCGFRFARTPDTLYYANDCGDATTRRYLNKQTPLFEVAPPHPNPADARTKTGIDVPFTAAKEIMLTWRLTDLKGQLIASSVPVRYGVGSQIVHIRAELLTSSGPAFLSLEATDVVTGARERFTTKIEVLK